MPSSSKVTVSDSKKALCQLAPLPPQSPPQATPQIEADKRLVPFKNYEQYLDSLITDDDNCYLQNTKIARLVAELGYRSSGETLTKEMFNKRLQAVLDYLYPKYIPYTLVSVGASCPDRIHKELALREHLNRLGIMSTILFIRYFTKTGFEVSGYIDYSERLLQENLLSFFDGHRIILPRPSDLGYYHWRTEKGCCNNSMNYKVIVDPRLGLLFQNRFDRKVICVDPNLPPGNSSVRLRVQTKLYQTAVLYDHMVVQRI